MRSSLISSSLLLALTSTLTNGAPLSSMSHSPTDCVYGTCSQSSQMVKALPHQSSRSRPHEVVEIEIEITEKVREFNGGFFTPSREAIPTQSYGAHRPYRTKYLESISRAKQSVEEKVARYLASHRDELRSVRHKHGRTPCNKKEWLVYLPGNVYITTHHYISRKPDVAIVGIVLVFLSFVVLAECIDRAFQCLRENRARGEIFLEEKDGEVRIIGDGISVVSWEDEKDALIRADDDEF